MKWRGQGILVLAVLGGAAALAYQWTSFEKLQDHAISYGINYAPYIRLVDEFVEREKRWPRRGEIDFTSVAEGGVIRAAELQENGEIRFTFSAWTIKSGYAEMVFAPTLNSHATTYAGGRLWYNCVEVTPASYESVICRSEGKISRAEVTAENDGAFDRWQNAQQQEQKDKSAFDAAVAAAENLPTQCDTIWGDVQANVIPCIEAINPELAAQLKTRGEELFKGPRLRPEVIARSPDLLVDFNRECEESWRTLAATVKANDQNTGQCF